MEEIRLTNWGNISKGFEYPRWLAGCLQLTVYHGQDGHTLET